MVDVSAKAITVRQALAAGDVVMAAATGEMIRAGGASKGDVLGVATLAAIQSTKLTAQLIPLCHAIPVEGVAVEFQWLDETPSNDSNRLRCLVRVHTSAKTGVEMEAITAAAIACVTVYDMVKSVDRTISIGPVQLLEKSGGKSGDFRREPE
ncbi:MAG: cyclic pyranopterin monophosphate synthase MoaC [Pirellulaceae bacterium]|nr:cyclic pyranopterin monophosphate synthase MoaC [Pirellulaceae bacterium]